jgi:splicing suppressor protein 51
MRSPKALSQPIRQPFTRLDNLTYLHPPMPEQDVYTLLIDAYRLRVTDTLNFDGPAKLRDEIFGGLSGASQTPLAGFRRFLEPAAARGSRSGNSNATILPPWWDESKQEACLSLTQGQGQQAGGNDTELCEWLNLSRRGKVDKAAVIERYGDPQFPMQLRMLAEAVYQRGVGGMAGTAMRKTMARMEQGGTGDMSASLFSITRPNV